jgi:hypothetical protein
MHQATYATYTIWAEQDEKISRIMMQIGTDRAVCILKYDREMIGMVSDEVVAVEFTKESGAAQALSNLIGVQIAVHGKTAQYDA